MNCQALRFKSVVVGFVVFFLRPPPELSDSIPVLEFA